MRIVLDTNVLVRAARPSSGPAREALKLITTGPHVLVLSAFLLTEVERVLHYPRVRAQHRLSEKDMQSFVASLHEGAEVVAVETGASSEPISTDPDDDPVLQTAVGGDADVLCTLDRHLRSRKVRAYCQWKGIQVMTDTELLRFIREARTNG